MKLIQRFLILICLVFLLIFCVSNGETMPIRFLHWETSALPVFLLLIFAFMFGVMFALLWQSLRAVTRSGDKNERKKKQDERKTQESLESVATSTKVAENRPVADQPMSDDTGNEGEKQE